MANYLVLLSVHTKPAFEATYTVKAGVCLKQTSCMRPEGKSVYSCSKQLHPEGKVKILLSQRGGSCDKIAQTIFPRRHLLCCNLFVYRKSDRIGCVGKKERNLNPAYRLISAHLKPWACLVLENYNFLRCLTKHTEHSNLLEYVAAFTPKSQCV